MPDHGAAVRALEFATERAADVAGELAAEFGRYCYDGAAYALGAGQLVGPVTRLIRESSG